MIKMNCIQCGKKFSFYPCEKNRKFCSFKCYWKSLIGNIVPWNKGKKMTKKYCDTVAKTMIGLKGETARGWRGGRRMDSWGYVLIYSPNHPYKNNSNAVRENRLVMEKYLGRYLSPKEVVHHINGDTSDNRIENLRLFKNHSEHMKYHHPKGERFKKKSRHHGFLV